ncbi:hypothetical protein NGA73_09970, partial [Streptococcus suis]|nr:hypothetical protein [Streptococcus suis]
MQELGALGFQLIPHVSSKTNLETFVRKCHILTENTDFALSNSIA